jgi:hypothetical protein
LYCVARHDGLPSGIHAVIARSCGGKEEMAG